MNRTHGDGPHGVRSTESVGKAAREGVPRADESEERESRSPGRVRALSHGGRTVSEAVRPTDLSQAGESREVGVDAASVTPPSQAVMKCPGCCDHRETLTSGEGARLAREDVSFLSPGTCLCSCRRGFREMARAPGPGDAIQRPAGAELARWSLCRVRRDVTSAGPPPAWPHAGAGPARSAHPRPAVRSTSLMTWRLRRGARLQRVAGKPERPTPGVSRPPDSRALRGLPCSPRAGPSSPSSAPPPRVAWLHSVVLKTRAKPCAPKRTEGGARGPAAPPGQTPAARDRETPARACPHCPSLLSAAAHAFTTVEQGALDGGGSPPPPGGDKGKTQNR